MVAALVSIILDFQKRQSVQEHESILFILRATKWHFFIALAFAVRLEYKG